MGLIEKTRLFPCPTPASEPLMHAQVIRRRMLGIHIVDLDDLSVVHAGDAVGMVKICLS
jgi:hypothetical protein